MGAAPGPALTIPFPADQTDENSDADADGDRKREERAMFGLIGEPAFPWRWSKLGRRFFPGFARASANDGKFARRWRKWRGNMSAFSTPTYWESSMRMPSGLACRAPQQTRHLLLETVVQRFAFFRRGVRPCRFRFGRTCGAHWDGCGMWRRRCRRR